MSVQVDSNSSREESSGARRDSEPSITDADYDRRIRIEPQRDLYMTPYERLIYDLTNDKKVQREVMQGKRIGFYRIRGELGTGNFSQVKLGVQILTKEKVAIKILDKTKLDAKTQRLLSREISSMERLHHPNIIRLYEVVETLSKLFLVTEYAGEGELFTRVSNKGRLGEEEARPLFAQIVSAVRHMHDKHIVHRDLKAENIFFSHPRAVKVGDFGFSKRAPLRQPLDTYCGSPPYAAPELFRDDSYDGPRVDVWALGVILYFMVAGLLPFRADTVGKLKKCILDGVYDIPMFLSDRCKALIRLLLSPAPADRPTVRGVVGVAWLEGEEFIDEMDSFNLFDRKREGGVSPFIDSDDEESNGEGFGSLRLGGTRNAIERSEVVVEMQGGQGAKAPPSSNVIPHRSTEKRISGKGSAPTIQNGQNCDVIEILNHHRNGNGCENNSKNNGIIQRTGRCEADEADARRACQELGVTAELLDAARTKRSRSAVSGTYHIVLHHIQKRRSVVDNPIQKRTSVSNGSGGGGGRGNEGTVRENGEAKSSRHSKLCAIL